MLSHAEEDAVLPVCAFPIPVNSKVVRLEFINLLL